MPHAGILGTGLIGASIGLGLRSAGWDVTGWDPDPDALATALEIGALSLAGESRERVIGGPANLLVLAGPPDSVAEGVATVDASCLVIDVAGVKGPIVATARPNRFVGTHPMAGREHSGPGAASAGLFRGAAWVVATDGASADDLAEVEQVVRSLGAHPVRMTAEEHDGAVAVISHLPQLLAATLLSAASDRKRAMDLAAGSFRDLTRVAASDPETWAQLLLANRSEVAGALGDLRDRLDRLSDVLGQGDAPSLRSLLAEGQMLRRGLAPPVVAVRISLRDEPGELARVGRALERSGVDVRDLQLRHAPYGGGGVLTLSVRPGEAGTLRTAAADEGLPVEG